MWRTLEILYLRWQARRLLWKLVKIRKTFKYGLILLRKNHPEVVTWETRMNRIMRRLQDLESV